MMMNKLVVVLLVAGCGASSRGERHAVGTYIGGGSLLFGADNCTYRGTPGVFLHSATPEPGPRFVRGAGTVTIECPKVTRDVPVVVPTNARIWGESKMKVGATQRLTANLVAGDRDLVGDAREEWLLAFDCAGIVSFGPLTGAQDTGRDRGRSLTAVGKGRCDVIVQLTTGSVSEGVPTKAFQQSMMVTVK